MFLNLLMSAFVLAVLWQYFPTATRAAGRFGLETLVEGLPDLICDPDALWFAGFLLFVWALVVALRFVVHLAADLLSGSMRGGPQGLGLN